MPSWAAQFPGPMQRLAAYIDRLGARVSGLEGRGFRIPVVDVDPVASDPVNAWLFADKRLRVRNADGTVIEFRPYDMPNVPTLSADPAASTEIRVWIHAGTTELRVRDAGGTVRRFAPITGGSSSSSGPSSGTSGTPKPAHTQRKTYRKTYSATWSATYDGGNDKRSESGHIYYGKYSDTWGEQKVQIGFPYSTIFSDLSGSEVKQFEVYLQNLHSYYNGGVDIYFGYHDNGSAPSDYTGVNATGISHAHWGKSESRSRTLSLHFAKAFRAGSARGLVINQPSSSIGLYGYASGANDGGYAGPKIRITYVK